VARYEGHTIGNRTPGDLWCRLKTWENSTSLSPVR
jgi:hypothetical protein